MFTLGLMKHFSAIYDLHLGDTILLNGVIDIKLLYF